MEEYVTLEDFLMGRREEYPEDWCEEYETNAKELLLRVNSLIRDVLKHKKDLKICVTSGWRPPKINAKIGGAPRSRHMICQAIDLLDDDCQSFGKYLELNQNLLKSRGLAIEDIRYCRKKQKDGSVAHWVHIQFPPPRSGRTVFIPYAGPPPTV